MKKIIKELASCIIVIALVVFTMTKLSDLMQRKDGDFKYAPFFEHAEDMDVLFMGTSHVINSVFPMELWNDYGITSYNFGGHANVIPTTYWVMENALDYAKPKVVVIDCKYVDRLKKTSTKFAHVHLSMDAFPLSLTKIKAVNDLLDDPVIDELAAKNETNDAQEKRTKIGLLWDYSVYHSRWTDIGEKDFLQEKTKEYGAESRIQIAQPEKTVKNKGEVFEEPTVGMDYLEKMIESCKKRNIEVLLVYLPHPVLEQKDWKAANTTELIAKKYGVHYINFLENDVVDFSTDCYDPHSHLNPSGAWKVTSYIGDYLVDHYDLKDHRGEEQYSYWDSDYETYLKMKEDRLQEIGDLNTYLMLLEDKNFGYLMDIGDSEVFRDSVTMKLLKNKGIDTDRIDDTTRYIFVCGDRSAVINEDDLAGTEYDNNGLTLHINDRSVFGEFVTDEEKFELDRKMFEHTKGQVKISVFLTQDPDVMFNTSVFSIPEEHDSDGRIQNEKGIVILSSKAVRVKEQETDNDS